MTKAALRVHVHRDESGSVKSAETAEKRLWLTAATSRWQQQLPWVLMTSDGSRIPTLENGSLRRPQSCCRACSGFFDLPQDPASARAAAGHAYRDRKRLRARIEGIGYIACHMHGRVQPQDRVIASTGIRRPAGGASSAAVPRISRTSGGYRAFSRRPFAFNLNGLRSRHGSR
jgi:hypothetical protein